MLHKNTKIVTVDTKENDKFLHKKTKPFDFSKHSKEEVHELVRNMRKIMHRENGIGLAANQIGLPYSMFVAEIPTPEGKKFYAIFNPKITKKKGSELYEEGCLSVPGTHGAVKRAEQVVLKGQDKNGKKVKIKAWGVLAHVFQHEVDHLNGTLFTDKAEQTFNHENHEITEII